MSNYFYLQPNIKIANLTNEEKDAIIQGVEAVMDYNGTIPKDDLIIYNQLIKERG